LHERSVKVIDNGKKIGVDIGILAEDLEIGNSKVNLVFVANIFNVKPGIQAK